MAEFPASQVRLPPFSAEPGTVSFGSWMATVEHMLAGIADARPRILSVLFAITGRAQRRWSGLHPKPAEEFPAVSWDNFVKLLRRAFGSVERADEQAERFAAIRLGPMWTYTRTSSCRRS